MSSWLLGFAMVPLASYFGGEIGLLASLAEATAMGMPIKLSAWGFGVPYGSYSGEKLETSLESPLGNLAPP